MSSARFLASRAIAQFASAVLAIVCGCTAPDALTDKIPTQEGPQRPQTVVLLATPKMIPDFAHPGAAVGNFLRRYEPLTSRASETVVIFAVGNSEHILTYRGPSFFGDSVEWARQTDGKRTSNRILYYSQVAEIVRAFKDTAAAMGTRVKLFDQIDPGPEFTFEYWKYSLHPECMDLRWNSFDIRGILKADAVTYASAPRGIVAGTQCGQFIVDQTSRYMTDVGFDGIMYGNQFATRGQWLPDNGPGYSQAEADGIRQFLDYSKRVFGSKDILWFDTYNNVGIERAVYSFPSDGYAFFDYILTAGFCVVADPERYVLDLESKLALPHRGRVLATLDYVDPWYSYNSMIDFPAETRNLESVAIQHRSQIDGFMFFANDEVGGLVPRAVVESFASRYFLPPPVVLAP